MPERDLALDDAGAVPGRRPRPRLVPLPPPADDGARTDAAALADEAAELRHLSEMLVHLLRDWTCRAQSLRLARRQAGLPPVGLSWENEIVDQYAARLGPDGADIALALLSLSRPRTVVTRKAGNGDRNPAERK